MVVFHDPSESDEFHESAVNELNATLAHATMRSVFLKDVDPAGYELSRPHRLYEFDGDQGVPENWLESARFTGWRFLAVGPHDEAPPFSMVFTSDRRKGAIARGPLVQRTLDVIHGIDEMGIPAEADHEMRLLQVPSLLAGFVWLAKPQDDYLIPITGRARLFQEMTLLRPAEIREELDDLLIALRERA